MKRLFTLLLAIVMVFLLAACSSPDNAEPSSDASTQPVGNEEGPQYGGHLDVRVASTLVSLDHGV